MVGTVFLGFCPGPALKQQSTWPNIPLSWAWQEEPEVFVNEVKIVPYTKLRK